MSVIDILLETTGFVVAAWWVTGVLMFAFGCKVFVSKGCPWSSRIWTVVVSGFVLPWLWWQVGKLPMCALIPAEPTPQQIEEHKQWMIANCSCRHCRSKRGEE